MPMSVSERIKNIQDEYRPLESLTPNPRNYNQHGPKAVTRMANRIQHNGFTAPLIITAAGLILAGHARRLALLQLRADNQPEPKGVESGWHVPCRVGVWTDEQQLAILAGDNANPEFADFDWPTLTEILTELDAQSALAGAGYDTADLDTLLSELAQTQAGELAAGTTAQRKLGDRAKQVKPVLYLDEVADFERALKATGKKRRAEALLTICREWLRHREEGQLHPAP